MSEYIKVSRVEDWLYGALKECLGVKVYPGPLPQLLESQPEAMASFEIIRNTDTSEYGRGRGTAMAEVWIYTRASSKGIKAVPRMDALEDAFAELTESRGDEHYTLTELYAGTGFIGEIGYHYRRAMVQILIH